MMVMHVPTAYHASCCTFIGLLSGIRVANPQAQLNTYKKRGVGGLQYREPTKLQAQKLAKNAETSAIFVYVCMCVCAWARHVPTFQAAAAEVNTDLRVGGWAALQPPQ